MYFLMCWRSEKEVKMITKSFKKFILSAFCASLCFMSCKKRDDKVVTSWSHRYNNLSTVITLYFYRDDTFSIKQLSGGNYLTLARGTYIGDTTKNTFYTNVVELTYIYEYDDRDKLLEKNESPQTESVVIKGHELHLEEGDDDSFDFTRDY